MILNYTLGQVSKALAAGCTAAGGTVVTAVAQDGVSGGELAVIILSTLAAFFAVFATPNAAKT